MSYKENFICFPFMFLEALKKSIVGNLALVLALCLQHGSDSNV